MPHLRNPWLLDGAVAVVLFAVTGVTVAARAPATAATVLALLLAAGACASVLGRRRWPGPAFTAATVLAEAFLAVSGTEAGVLVLAAPLVVLYSLAQNSWPRAALFGGVALLVVFALHAAARPEWASAQNVALLALGGLAVAAGEAARSRRAYVAAVEARARQAELGLEQEARRRVTEERLRIARELHDVLGHRLALITVHAGAAADVLDERPDAARTSLGHIKQAGKDALAELRDVVVLLRAPEEPATPTEPAGGLAGLDDLLAAFTRSGLRVDHQVVGPVRPLPAPVDRTAYRVIQEALTNVAKHAPGSPAAVRVEYRPDRLHLIVDDEGPGPVRAAGGHGLTGMRERVGALGGRLTTGPGPRGGFRVDASLPLTGTGCR